MHPPGPPKDFSQYTLGEIQEMQQRSNRDPERVFALGKYQIIPATMNRAIDELQLDLNQRFTPEVQDRMFTEHLLVDKRPSVRRFIEGDPGTNLQDAQRALAQEWASFPDPYKGGRSFYNDGVNKAHISLEQSATALTQLREQYRDAISQGMTADDAWRVATRIDPEQRQVATMPSMGKRDPIVGSLQRNLVELGITDARGQPLTVDNDRGTRTHEAIATFQRRFGLEGRQLSNAELLTATHVALQDPVRSLEQAVRSVVPEALQQQRASSVDGVPTYLLSGRSISAARGSSEESQSAEAEQSPLSTTTELQLGDRGAAVHALQQHLHLLGATDLQGKELKPDRDYGNRTKQAVEQFQLWTGREVTGIADSGTLEALQAHSQFLMQQKARGITPGEHVADNLRPTSENAEVGADLRPVQGQRAAQPAPSFPETAAPPAPRDPRDPDHADHALYEALKQRLPGIAEDRLIHVTAACHMQNFRPEQIDRIAITDRAIHISSAGPDPGQRVSLDLNAAPPAPQALQQQVQAYDQQQALLATQWEQARAVEDPTRSGLTR
jgi:peptidoglycan hydrolase-like protein with peptidoglycan-binding domain